MKRVLYLSVDGLLEPLGFSQVVRVVEGLATRGWRYHILSLEKRKDLESLERLRAVESRLARSGIGWTRLEWTVGGARAALRNIANLTRSALQLAPRGFEAMHARSHVAAAAAYTVWLATRIPYLFDTRAYWIDERIEDGKWFTSPLRVAVARGLEYQLFARAAGVVTLTELQAEDVRHGQFGPLRGRPVACIPTCADFDDFQRRPVAACPAIPRELVARLAGRRVLGIIGSLNKSYCWAEMLSLARLVLEKDPQAVLLVLSAQAERWKEEALRAGVPADRFIATRANHDDMPQWMSVIDWGLMLLVPASRAKRASMPTKLAEFLASGVRPVHSGCNEEVTGWVRRAGSGLALESLDSGSLERAAMAMVTLRPDSELAVAREVARAHFSLESGIARYDSVLDLVSSGRTVQGSQ